MVQNTVFNKLSLVWKNIFMLSIHRLLLEDCTINRELSLRRQLVVERQRTEAGEDLGFTVYSFVSFGFYTMCFYYFF